MSDEIAIRLIEALKENTASNKIKTIESGVLNYAQAIEFLGYSKELGRRWLNHLKKTEGVLSPAGSSTHYYRDELIIAKQKIKDGVYFLPLRKKAA